jgi:hypothetical protein
MNYVVCLKHGKKYGSEYVNRLYNMCKRHLTVPFEFVCFTESNFRLLPEIKVYPLPDTKGMKGWWYKPMFFDKNLPVKGTILYFDLDVVIFENIDKLFTYEPGKFCIIRDFNRHVRPEWDKMNSSVFRLETGQHSHVYDNFVYDPKQALRLHGDQDWIYLQTIKKEFSYWPDDWIRSYKWEMRGKPPMEFKNGKRNFKTIGEPIIEKDNCIAVFHGDPNPSECKDPWVIDNWK